MRDERKKNKALFLFYFFLFCFSLTLSLSLSFLSSRLSLSRIFSNSSRTRKVEKARRTRHHTLLERSQKGKSRKKGRRQQRRETSSFSIFILSFFLISRFFFSLPLSTLVFFLLFLNSHHSLKSLSFSLAYFCDLRPSFFTPLRANRATTKRGGGGTEAQGRIVVRRRSSLFLAEKIQGNFFVFVFFRLVWEEFRAGKMNDA